MTDWREVLAQALPGMTEAELRLALFDSRHGAFATCLQAIRIAFGGSILYPAQWYPSE